MHSFSIDFITRDSAHNGEAGYQQEFEWPTETTTDGNNLKASQCRESPSPTDSGMESDNSSPTSSDSGASKTSSIDEVLLALDKTAKRHVTSKLSDDEKPTHSYIALISMAILSDPERKMLLSDIYQYIMDNYSYYNNEAKAWRNSIRHNLSLNECFVKNGRADNGKGNYWSIHPACTDDFSKGDFRRRQARRRARKSLKDSSGDMTSVYRHNVGYVPMTSSHIGYHPYAAAASSLYYQQTAQNASAQVQSNSASNYNVSPSSLLSGYSQQNLPGYYSPCSMGQSTSSTSAASISVAAAQRFFTERNGASLAAQSFQHQLPSSLQFQNW